MPRRGVPDHRAGWPGGRLAAPSHPVPRLLRPRLSGPDPRPRPVRPGHSNSVPEPRGATRSQRRRRPPTSPADEPGRRCGRDGERALGHRRTVEEHAPPSGLQSGPEQREHGRREDRRTVFRAASPGPRAAPGIPPDPPAQETGSPVDTAGEPRVTSWGRLLSGARHGVQETLLDQQPDGLRSAVPQHDRVLLDQLRDRVQDPARAQ